MLFGPPMFDGYVGVYVGGSLGGSLGEGARAQCKGYPGSDALSVEGCDLRFIYQVEGSLNDSLWPGMARQPPDAKLLREVAKRV